MERPTSLPTWERSKPSAARVAPRNRLQNQDQDPGPEPRSPHHSQPKTQSLRISKTLTSLSSRSSMIYLTGAVKRWRGSIVRFCQKQSMIQSSLNRKLLTPSPLQTSNSQSQSPSQPKKQVPLPMAVLQLSQRRREETGRRTRRMTRRS